MARHRDGGFRQVLIEKFASINPNSVPSSLFPILFKSPHYSGSQDLSHMHHACIFCPAKLAFNKLFLPQFCPGCTCNNWLRFQTRKLTQYCLGKDSSRSDQSSSIMMQPLQQNIFVVLPKNYSCFHTPLKSSLKLKFLLSSFPA